MANFGADLGGLASGFLGGMGAVENIQMSRERLEAEKIKVREAKKQEEYLNSPAPNIKMSNFYNSFEPAQQQILDSTLARHGFKKGMTNRDFMNVVTNIGLENKVYSELTAMGETSALLKIQKLHEKLNKTEDPNEKVKIQNEINQTKKAYQDSNAKILDLQSKFIGQIPKMNATFASKKPVEKDGELYQTQIVEDPDNPGSYKIQDVWVGTAKAKEPTSEIGVVLSGNAEALKKIKDWEEYKARLRKQFKKPEKPEMTPNQALKRISAIEIAIAKLQSGDALDKIIALQLDPKYQSLIGETDPKVKEAAVSALKEERDYIRRFAPERKVKVPTGIPAEARDTGERTPDGKIIYEYKGQRGTFE